MPKIQLRLYRANTSYIQYLQSVDKDENGVTNVKDNEKNGSLRPYIGISMDNYTYYIPVCSKKNKHYNMKDSIDFIKLEDGAGLISVLNINNMIPIPDNLVEIIDVNSEPEKQKFMLQKEIRQIRKKREQIIKSANDVYKIKTQHSENNPNLSSRCADFRLLEQKMSEYIARNNL